MQYSDIRLKTDVEDLIDCLRIVTELNGRAYQWKKDAQALEAAGELTPSSASTSTEDSADDPDEKKKNGPRVLGFIAQELQRVVPDAVRVTARGYLVVSYTTLVPILVEALKEHYAATHVLREELASSAAAYHVSMQETFLLLREAVDKLGSVDPEEEAANKPRLPSSGPPKVPIKPSRDANKRSCWCSKPLCWFLVAGAVTAIITAVVLGIIFGLGVVRGPAAPSAPMAPDQNTTFTPQNWVTNGGFEDPSSSAWAGNYSYYEYGVGSKRRVAQDLFPLVDEAPAFFDAGRYAAHLFVDPTALGTPGLSSAILTQDVNLTALMQDFDGQDVQVYLDVTAWVHIAQRLPQQFTNAMTLGLSASRILKYSGSIFEDPPIFADPRNVSTWRQIRLTLAIATRYIPRRISLTLRSGIPGSVFIDNIAIALRTTEFASSERVPPLAQAQPQQSPQQPPQSPPVAAPRAPPAVPPRASPEAKAPQAPSPRAQPPRQAPATPPQGRPCPPEEDDGNRHKRN